MKTDNALQQKTMKLIYFQGSFGHDQANTLHSTRFLSIFVQYAVHSCTATIQLIFEIKVVTMTVNSMILVKNLKYAVEG